MGTICTKSMKLDPTFSEVQISVGKGRKVHPWAKVGVGKSS